jgi:hypothetical protein
MATCAGAKCKNKLDANRVRRDWCSHECWDQGQDEMAAYLRRFRAENPKPLKLSRTLSDEPEVLGQPVGWMPWK